MIRSVLTHKIGQDKIWWGDLGGEARNMKSRRKRNDGKYFCCAIGMGSCIF